MLKKRLIFTLLFEDNQFILSRNFRRQKVGDINWLHKNYNFSKLSFYIDELIVINISKKNNFDQFSDNLKSIVKNCFVPVTAGGGIRNINHAKMLLRSGADKIIINSSLFHNEKLNLELVSSFGRQCVVGSIDVKKKSDNIYEIYTNYGETKISSLRDFSQKFNFNKIGELYLNSIDKDGTGQGYDLGILDFLDSNCSVPIIFAGGAGNSLHLLEGLKHDRVDAVSTANLFNFVGDGLSKARHNLIEKKMQLANW